jgi:hypothetical protein
MLLMKKQRLKIPTIVVVVVAVVIVISVDARDNSGRENKKKKT